ncbi:MAG: OadG family protein [Clostridiales bacterium]|nr:OadG family protein [Clostridiales bacterium]
MDATFVGAVVLTGIVVVFIALILLVLYFSIQGKILSKSLYDSNDVKKKLKPTENKTLDNIHQIVLPQTNSDEDEVVAVISAVIASLSVSDGKTYKVKSIKPVKSYSSSRPAWAMAGLRENTTPF